MKIYENLFLLFLFLLIGYYSLKYLFFIVIGIIIGFYLTKTYYNYKQPPPHK
jgi:hypothetical protein